MGNTLLVKDRLLPAYATGRLIVGTYDTRYGPKPVRIQSLRIRKPPAKKKKDGAAKKK